MAEAFRTAIELDDYILSHQHDEDTLPTAYRDQVNAAADECIRLAEAGLGHERVWVGHEGIIEWVRLGMLDTLLKWSKGQVLTCIHRPDFNRPEPVVAAAWKPGVVVCVRCADMLSVTGTPADATCDGCGHLCAGMPDDGILPFVTFTGCLGYQAGACDRCHEDVLRVQRQAEKG